MDTPARTAEDIIGIVPHTLGYTPERSLVAIIVVTDSAGRQSCATTLRVDFDLERAAQTLAEGGEWLRELVCRACAPSGVFLVLYDDEYLDEGHLDDAGRVRGDDGLRLPDTGDDGDEALEDLSDIGYGQLRRSLIRGATDEFASAFADAGIDTLSAWWVSAGRFGRIDDHENSSTDLAAAQSSACATELVSTGSAPARSPADLVVRPAGAAARAAFRAGVDDLRTRLTMTESFDVIVETYPALLRLRSATDTVDRESLAAVMTPRTVMALDRILTEKWSRDALEMVLSFDHPDFLPERVAGSGPGELVGRARRAGASRLAAEKMIGLSPRPPQARDVLLAIAFLESYALWGRPATLATAYAVIAWFHWSLGGATMAEQYGLAALAVDPEQSMARLMVDAVQHGLLPEWLMSGQSRPRPVGL